MNKTITVIANNNDENISYVLCTHLFCYLNVFKVKEHKYERGYALEYIMYNIALAWLLQREQ